MSRTAIDTETINRSGFNLSAANKNRVVLADGISFVNTGKEFLYLESIHDSNVTVTIQTGKTVDGLAVAERTITLEETGTAGDIQLVGPFPPDVYNQGSGGLIYVDVSVDDVVDAIACVLTTS
jgi:hypothetical protein